MRSNGYAARHTRNVMVGEACANVDYKYGPYDSVEQAFSELNEMEVCAVGLTVGIVIEGRIKEYWFETACSSADDLVPKSYGTVSVSVYADTGNIKLASDNSTLLYAKVYSGTEDITDKLDDTQFSWTRTSVDTVGDELWNKQHEKCGKTVELDDYSVVRKALFECLVDIS